MMQKIVAIIICLFSLGSMQAMKRAVVLLNKANKSSAVNFSDSAVSDLKIFALITRIRKENAAQENNELHAKLQEQIRKHKEVKKKLLQECDNLELGMPPYGIHDNDHEWVLLRIGLNEKIRLGIMEAFYEAGVGDDD